MTMIPKYEYPELSVRIQPGIGVGYPELKRIVADFLQKVGDAKYLPDTWKDDVAKLQRERPNDIVMLDSTNKFGIPGELWSQLYETQRKTILAYTSRKLEEGRKIMASANANAAFWDVLYRGTKAVADAPKVIAGEAGNLLTSVSGAFLKKGFIGLLIVAGLYFLYNQRATIAGKVAGKIGK